MAWGETVASPAPVAQPTPAIKAEARERFDRGVRLFEKGENASALAEFKRVNEIIPTPLVLYNMGDARLALSKYEEAIQCYTHAAEADPAKRHEALNRIGEAFVRQGKSDKAITYFRQAIEINPRFVTARLNLCRLLAGQKRYAEACQQFDEALKIAPQNTPAHEALEAARRAMQSQGY